MEGEIAAHRNDQLRTFLDSDGYILEVDFKGYAGQLRQNLASIQNVSAPNREIRLQGDRTGPR